ncbi:MAG: carboxypeptidase-like regulatory domain-containing protein, partial [Bacteroidales bacterium]
MTAILSGQERMLRGIITDSAGFAIPGASIHIPGTQKGTVSGSDGRFALALDTETRTVIFSCVGYTTDTLFLGPGDLTDDL